MWLNRVVLSDASTGNEVWRIQRDSAATVLRAPYNTLVGDFSQVTAKTNRTLTSDLDWRD
jgi:hypothetical protein